MDFAQTLAEDRRLVILRVLAEAPGWTANTSILHSALQPLGHRATRDQVAGDVAWLAEQQLLSAEQLGSVTVARLTDRGLDVAEGRARVPGVKRPSPGA